MKTKLAILLLLIAPSLYAQVATYRGESASLVQSATAASPVAPSGLATGDLEIMAATTEFGQTLSITTAGGSSWTALTGSPVNGTTGAGEVLYVWWRIRQSGDSDPTVTASGDHVGGYRMAIQVGTFDSVTPIEIENTGSENTTADTSYSYAPGTTTLGANRLVFAIAASTADFATVTVTAAANATLANVANTNFINATSGNGGGSNACRGELATAGSVGTFSATWGNATKKNYCSFAVRPASLTNPGAFLQLF
jgi:hypothetical protein